MATRIDRIFVGELRPLPPEGQMSGMFKTPVDGPIAVGPLGLAGDHQGDPRVHGGPEKAINHYPAQHYRTLAALRPALAPILAPGLLGENLSVAELDEETVCIGDIYRAGDCRLQVSAPRSPCWKINRRTEDPTLSQFVAERGFIGWYYRVLTPGTLAAGQMLEREARPAPAVSVARLWRATQAHRPDGALLEELAATPGLSPGWQRKLAERREWLRRHAGA